MVSWFRRHLNWTLFLGCGVLPNVLLFLFYVSEGYLGVFFVLIVAVISLWTEVWYLRRKGRSLWNVCWNLLNGLGLIVLLCLANEGRVFRVWEIGEQVKTVDADCSLKELQGILSCTACAFFDEQAGGGQAWCNSPRVPDIEGSYCSTFVVRCE